MKIIDRNGRLFGKISVIDVLVILVVIVMAAALYFKSNQTHTGTAVTEQTITFQVRARGVDNFVADAIRVDDYLYDQSYSSGGQPLGQIIEVQVERDPGTKLADKLTDGTAGLLERMPSRETICFPESVFSGNGTDIDNRCGQELDLSEAVFEP